MGIVHIHLIFTRNLNILWNNVCARSLPWNSAGLFPYLDSFSFLIFYYSHVTSKLGKDLINEMKYVKGVHLVSQSVILSFSNGSLNTPQDVSGYIKNKYVQSLALKLLRNSIFSTYFKIIRSFTTWKTKKNLNAMDRRWLFLKIREEVFSSSNPFPLKKKKISLFFP